MYLDKKVRVGVFETNSSSTHSICIAENLDNKIDINEIYPGDNINIYTGEFGWEPDTFCDFETKASYLVTGIINEDNDEYKNMLYLLIENRTNKKVTIIDHGGYIDHQSSSVFNQAFANYDTLEKFLFSRDSYLETDNDNH